MLVRPARPSDYPAVAELTVAAYRAIERGSGYEAALADVAGRAAVADVLVADDDGIVGAVALIAGGTAFGQLARPGEATFRMLAVSPAAQRRGVGAALVRAALDWARERGYGRVVICTDPRMAAAQQLYARLGFTRAPSRDWQPERGPRLLAYEREL